MTDIDSTYDQVLVAEKLLIQQDILCSQRGICLRTNEDSSGCLVQSLSVVGSLVKSTRSVDQTAP